MVLSFYKLIRLIYYKAMLLTVPYFKQDIDSSCGPAVLHMVTCFYEIPRSPREIQRMTNTDPHHGTSNADLQAAAVEMGFDAATKAGSSIEDIRKILREEEIPVIVNFIEPEHNEGHYTLVIGIDEGDIVFNDPWHGAGYKMTIKEFESRWKSGYEDRERWMMVMRTEPKDPNGE